MNEFLLYIRQALTVKVPYFVLEGAPRCSHHVSTHSTPAGEHLQIFVEGSALCDGILSMNAPKTLLPISGG